MTAEVESGQPAELPRMTEQFVLANDRPNGVTPADVPTYAPGNIWLDITARRSDAIAARGISFQPSHVRAPGMSAHLLVLYRRGQTLVTRRLAGPTMSEEVGPGEIGVLTSTSTARSSKRSRVRCATAASRMSLAGVAGVSSCYFSQLFRNSFGVPPHRYFLERRLMNARDLLQGKRHSIA
jgi:hypothetical protein